jgi:hypothetical protein
MDELHARIDASIADAELTTDALSSSTRPSCLES